MPKFQVIVEKGDQVWDSIRDTEESALFRVSEHMVASGYAGIVQMGDAVKWKLIFGKLDEAKAMLKKDGFTITVREIK